ncbi:MAG: hypothetical protein AAGA92_02140 [Planctomycetota bacterium]
MIDESTLKLLQCPNDGSALSVGGEDLVVSLNAAVAEGRLKNLGGEVVERPLDGVRVRESGDLAYPIFDGVPVLLADEAIRAADAG